MTSILSKESAVQNHLAFFIVMWFPVSFYFISLQLLCLEDPRKALGDNPQLHRR